MLGLLASFYLLPFLVIGQTGSRGNLHRDDLAVAPNLTRTTKYRHASIRRSKRIPFELSGSQIFLRGQVNGSARVFWFLLDTGASLSVLNVKQAQRLGLKAEGAESGSPALGSADIAYINNVTFNLNG